MRCIAEMPFPDQRGEVARLLQMPGEGRLRMGQVMQRSGFDELPLLWAFARPLRPDRHVQPRGMLAGEERRTARRADGHRVGMGEAKALLRESVEVRRLMQIRAVAAEVAPAQIIGEDEDDVGFGFSGM